TKQQALELGGRVPGVVCASADRVAAAEGAMVAKYRNAGQTCVCTNRIYVHASIYDAFIEKFSAKVNSLQIGDGFTDKVSQGPLIDDAAIQKVREHVEDALGKGAKVNAGGKAHDLGGRYFQPTVLSNISEDMLCMREETFGPLRSEERRVGKECRSRRAASHHNKT